jgi:hypothetical protein
LPRQICGAGRRSGWVIRLRSGRSAVGSQPSASSAQAPFVSPWSSGGLRRWHTVIAAGLEWGPLAAWAATGATVLVVITTSLVALGFFERFRAPRIRVTFENTEPWCRWGRLTDGTVALWVRLGVENTGKSTATGCVGRLIEVSTDGKARRDVDPVQLRWAGLPRSRAFQAIDLRPGQREYLNILFLSPGRDWHLVTFEDPDFDPGFTTDLPRQQQHLVQVSVLATNATASASLAAAAPSGEGDVLLHMH